MFARSTTAWLVLTYAAYQQVGTLDQLGTDVVAAQRGEGLPRRDQARLRRWHLTNRANLPHLLGVNQFFIDLAGYARTHPDASLDRWWPASRCQQAGAFREPCDDNLTVLAYKPNVRPDGHGIWTERDRQVPFFVEFDNNTMPLWRLFDKIDSYQTLAKMYQRAWPVLFSLHSAVRERHLHQELSEAGFRYPVATTVRDDAAQAGRCPAEAVWWLHRHGGALLCLADLATTVVNSRDEAA
jgi:hypothetical protein